MSTQALQNGANGAITAAYNAMLAEHYAQRLPVLTGQAGKQTSYTYVVCPKRKCTDFLFKCLLDSPEITSYLFQSMTLGKLHSGSNTFFH